MLGCYEVCSSSLEGYDKSSLRVSGKVQILAKKRDKHRSCAMNMLVIVPSGMVSMQMLSAGEHEIGILGLKKFLCWLCEPTPSSGVGRWIADRLRPLSSLFFVEQCDVGRG
eukprot:4314053-Amphidinium_carterae.2